MFSVPYLNVLFQNTGEFPLVTHIKLNYITYNGLDVTEFMEFKLLRSNLRNMLTRE